MDFLLTQIHTFLIMFGFGLLLGLVFDLYQRLIKRIKPAKMWVNFTDLFFSLSAGIGGFLVLFRTNRGELRFYVLLSILSGFIFYFYVVKQVGLMR